MGEGLEGGRAVWNGDWEGMEGQVRRGEVAEGGIVPLATY